jgi:hypothetical protein
MAQDMANRVELTGSRIVIESVCRERGGILLGLHGVRVHAEKEKFFFFFFQMTGRYRKGRGLRTTGVQEPDIKSNEISRFL